jgi:hypothetical protein
MAKGATTIKNVSNTRVKRKGVHAKTKTSKTKNSELYKKSYRGQGR